MWKTSIANYTKQFTLKSIEIKNTNLGTQQ